MRVGIDLGTTYCAVAYKDEWTGKPELIRNRYGNRLTPSVLAFVGNDILYGEEAAEYVESGHIRTATYYKRYMGCEEYGYEGNGVIYSAKELSSALLRHLIEDARKETGEQITEAVITVPAYFTHKERKATIEAAADAGLTVLHLMNEPTAAIYAYGAGKQITAKKVLVYDLGGGTFDVAVADVEGDRIRILGSDGNHDLGGKEWDDFLARYLCDVFYDEFGIDLSEDRGEMQHILRMAENIKKRLSVASSTDFVLSYLGKTGRYSITQRQFEAMTANLLAITTQICDRLLTAVGIKKEQIDGVLLVGGATRMPMVRRAVLEQFGEVIMNGINVDEAVAIGAAIKAAEEENVAYLPDIKEEEKKKRRWSERLKGPERVKDCTAHSLGMITISKDGRLYVNSIIIEKNREIPVSNTRSYGFATTPGKNEMEIYLLQGEGGNPRDCEMVGKYIVTGIADTKEGETRIDVTYSYNEEGMIEVSASQEGEELTVTVMERPADLSFLEEPPKVKQEQVTGEASGTLYLAVDLSGSMAGSPLLQAKQAIEEFLGKLDLRRLAVGIIGFADKVDVLLPPTRDYEKMEQTLINMRVDGNRFGYGNAASPFGTVFEAHQNAKEEGNDYLVLITDGVWMYKENAILEARKCKELGIEILALGFGTADEEFVNQVVSRQEYAEITELSCLTKSFTKIAQIVGS